MKAIVALEELIKKEELRVSFSKHQLSEHEAGTNKLTAMILASTETKLEEAEELLAKHKAMLATLLEQDIKVLEEQERLREAVKRRNYFHFQNLRIKRDRIKSNDVKLEAMMIIDELPTDISFEDNEIYEIAEKTIELHLTTHEELDKELNSIKQDFDKLLQTSQSEKINILGMLNFRIPIVVLHFSVLLSNIKENIQADKSPDFKGFPNYEDWWITELWSSHQAYFGLYKWKSIISRLCITTDQKRAWDTIFSNWIFIKKMINNKGSLGFNFNFAFDSLLSKYANLEEELSEVNLLSMETIVENLTKNEDFNTVVKDHNIITPYLVFKRKKLNYKETK